MRNGQKTFAIAQATFAAFGAKILAGVCVRNMTVWDISDRSEPRLSHSSRRLYSHEPRCYSERLSGWQRCQEWLANLNPARMCPTSNLKPLLSVVGG